MDITRKLCEHTELPDVSVATPSRDISKSSYPVPVWIERVSVAVSEAVHWKLGRSRLNIYGTGKLFTSQPGTKRESFGGQTIRNYPQSTANLHEGASLLPQDPERNSGTLLHRIQGTPRIVLLF